MLQLLTIFIFVFAIAVSAPLIRLAEAPALAIVFWRVALAVPITASIALWRRETWPLRRAAPAGVLLAFHWIAWVIAVQTTTISSASVLICTGAVWTAFISRRVFGEPVTRLQWIGVAVAFLGVCLVVMQGNSGSHSFFGDAMALLGSWIWVAYSAVGRQVRRNVSFWGYTASVMLSCALTMFVVMLLGGVPFVGFSSATWTSMIGLAVLPTLVGHAGFMYLMKHISAVRLNLITLAEPVVATLIAWPLFHEVPSAQFFWGGVLTGLGVALGFLGER